MFIIITLLVSIPIIGLVICFYLGIEKTKRRKYLESVKKEEIIVYAKNWKLKFRLKNSEKSFYVYGVYLSPSSEEFPKIVKETVKSQEDLDYFKEQLKTVQDVLNYEEDCRKMMEKEEQEKFGNFK
jgi:hypothetical protein